MIEVKDLYCGYGKETVLRGVCFTASQGDITTIIGPNGCGKSTLLKAVCNRLPIEGGDITIQGKSVKKLGEKQIARLIAYLPQGKNIPDINVYRMVLHGRFSYLGYPRKYAEADYEIAEAAMRQMGIWELQDRTLRTLSGGMRQKVYIAMALCQQAPVILMDEPTTYLDLKQQMKFNDTVAELKKDGKTVVLVLHDILCALRISDRILVMDGGKDVLYGAPDAIMSSDIIEDIFGVSAKTISVDGRTQYYYAVSKKA